MELGKIQSKENTFVLVDVSRIHYDPFEVLVTHVVIDRGKIIENTIINHEGQSKCYSMNELELKINEIIKHYDSLTMVDSLNGQLTLYNNGIRDNKS